jgi:AcrR family transcriptional regulator
MSAATGKTKALEIGQQEPVNAPGGEAETASPRLRADARANRARILTAAAELFSAHGSDMPMDDVARLAGVGKGTLYRRFHDRQHLLAAVAIDTFAKLTDAATEVTASEPDPWIRFCRYLRNWFGLRLGVIYQALCDDLPAIIESDPEVRSARATWLAMLEQLVTDAQDAGQLRRDIRAGDVALFMNLLQRSQNAEPLLRQSAERFLELMLDGLSVRRDVPLPGIALTTSALSKPRRDSSRHWAGER